ncbi:MAG TPA: hypothetical protein VGM90_26605 [Kofleriaceae bacterium]
MTRALALATILAIASSGCSFVLVHGPQTDEPEPLHWPSCTETRVLPLGDAIYGGLATAGAIVLLQSKDEWAPLGAAFLLPIGLTVLGSAYYGYTRTTRCQDARAAYEKAAEEGR